MITLNLRTGWSSDEQALSRLAGPGQAGPRAAQHSLEDEDFEWSAFQAQQAAGKGLKAFPRYNNLEVSSHTLVHLLEWAREFTQVDEELEGYPGGFYDKAIAERAIEYAQAIISFSFVEERIP